MSDLAGLVGDGGFVAEALPCRQNLRAGALIARLDAKRQAAPVEPHHGDAKLFKVEVLVNHERCILLHDNGVALQDNLLALGSGLIDGVGKERRRQKRQA